MPDTPEKVQVSLARPGSIPSPAAPAANVDPLIVIDKLRIIYNQGKSNETRALEETNLTIYPHEYVIIFGPSGCGKSTLLYSISGLQRATYGEVRIKGKAISKMSEQEELEMHQKEIGMIFQAFYLISSLTILDNVCLPRVFRGEVPAVRKKDGLSLLRRFGIAEQADKMPNQLSGGQKQRVAIARSIVNSPDIILADEPVGNLDSESAQNVLDILKELNDIDKKTIIMVTHNPEHLVYADRVIYMKDGRVIKEEVFKEKRPIVKEKKPEEIEEEKKTEDSELKLLMNSFKNLLPQQIDMLLIPFKAKQLLSHLLSQLSEEQVSMAEAFLKELLFKNIDLSTFESRLDLDIDQGGAGWNRMRSKAFSERVQEIIDVTQKIHRAPSEAVLTLAQYIEHFFKLKLSPEQKLRLQAALKQRLGSSIGQLELARKLDKSLPQGGVGLRKDTVEKITREVEIIMLLKYS